jgi:hypothetical protein
MLEEERLLTEDELLAVEKLRREKYHKLGLGFWIITRRLMFNPAPGSPGEKLRSGCTLNTVSLKIAGYMGISSPMRILINYGASLQGSPYRMEDIKNSINPIGFKCLFPGCSLRRN